MPGLPPHPIRLPTKAALLPLLCVLPLMSAAQTNVQKIESEGIARSEERREVQQSVDAVHQETRSLIDDYRAELKIVQGLEDYIGLLDKQLASQDAEINTLQTSIADVAVIERQVLPLMERMIDGLEQFIELDVPFLLEEERRGKISELRTLLPRADVTVAEKARKVFEAYQIENEYGRTIEAYTGKLELDGGSFDAEFLRIGRVALLYRTFGDARLGFWDSERNHWTELPASPYRRLIEQGLKVARQEIAPELISVPLNPSHVEVR
jgi:hypothetical protein